MSYRQYQDIFQQMQQISDDMMRGFMDFPVGIGRFWHPPVDIYESEQDILVKVELPGVKADDLNVSLSSDDRLLTIGGIRKEPEGERRGRLHCHQLEIYFGPFERIVSLPSHIRVRRDEIKAVYREGFLLVTLPKETISQKQETRTIPIINEDQVDRDQAPYFNEDLSQKEPVEIV